MTCKYQNCINLTSIEIPNSVTSIKEYAFLLCLNLTSVNIPESVKNIGYFAFNGCSLTTVTIPNSVTSIGFSAFGSCLRLISIMVDIANPNYDSRNNCNAIIETSTNTLISGCKNTTIPNSVTSIGDFAFLSCPDLISITIPGRVKSIGYSAFRNCTGLVTIDIPDNVTSIGDNAFKYCTSLTSVTIPNSVTSIGDEAFYGCSSLTSITIPNSVMNIGNRAFSGCSNLTSVSISDSMTSIGESTFEDCSRLTSIHIPEGVTTIERSAFFGCKRLTSIDIPSSVKSIGNNAFYGCPIIRIYLSKATKYENYSFDKYTEVVKSRVFISYSWDNDIHKAWVERLATDLNKYVYVILDQWDLRAGNDMAHFMEQSVSQSDKVLCILTPNYKQKCDSRKGGSGYESSLISAEIVRVNPPSKFIPILRSGDFVNSCPLSLSPRLGLDFSSNDPEIYKKMLEKLLREIKEESLRPN